MFFDLLSDKSSLYKGLSTAYSALKETAQPEEEEEEEAQQGMMSSIMKSVDLVEKYREPEQPSLFGEKYPGTELKAPDTMPYWYEKRKEKGQEIQAEKEAKIKALPAEDQQQVADYWEQTDSYTKKYMMDAIEQYESPINEFAAKVSTVTPQAIRDASAAVRAGLGAFALEAEKAVLTGGLAILEKDYTVGIPGYTFEEKPTKNAYTEKLYEAISFLEDAQIAEMGELKKGWQENVAELTSGVASLAAAYITAGVGGGLASMGVANIVAKGSKWGAAVLAFMETSSSYIGSRRAGEPPSKAMQTWATSMAAVYLSEKAGLDFLFGKGKGTAFTNFMDKFVFEGGQEVTQTLMQDVIESIGYKKAFSSFGDYWSSFWVGGVIGGATSLTMDFTNYMSPASKLSRELQKGGLTKEEAEQTIKDFTTYSMTEGHNMMAEVSEMEEKFRERGVTSMHKPKDFSTEFVYKTGPKIFGQMSAGEISKYKSAEEFIKDNGGLSAREINKLVGSNNRKYVDIDRVEEYLYENGMIDVYLYHGTPKDLQLEDLDPDRTGENIGGTTLAKGVYFSNKKSVAEDYRGYSGVVAGKPSATGRVIEATLKNARLKIINSNVFITEERAKPIRHEGYDGILRKGVGGSSGFNEYIIFNKEILTEHKPKDFSTEFVYKTGPKVFGQMSAGEISKYKSAKEFMENRIQVPAKGAKEFGEYKLVPAPSSKFEGGDAFSGVKMVPPKDFEGVQFSVDTNIVDKKVADIKSGKPIKPIIIKEGRVIDGYHTAEALHRLGFKEFPAIFVEESLPGAIKEWEKSYPNKPFPMEEYSEHLQSSKYPDAEVRLAEVWEEAQGMTQKTGKRKLGELSDEERAMLEKYQELGSNVEMVKDSLKMYSKEEVVNFRKLRKLIEENQEGDIETLRKSHPHLLNTSIEAVQEMTGVSEEAAFNFIKDMPTRVELGKIVSERHMMKEDIRKINRRLERAEKLEDARRKKDEVEAVKTQIVQHAKAIPLRERGKLLIKKVLKAETPKQLKEIVERIGELEESSKRKQHIAEIEKEMEEAKPKKERNIRKWEGTASAQQKLGIIKAMLDEGSRVAALQKIQENISKYADKEVPPEVRQENAILWFTGMKEMDSSELARVAKIVKQVREGGRIEFLRRQSNEQEELQQVKDTLIDEIKADKELKKGRESGVKTERKLNFILETLDWMDTAMLGYRNLIQKITAKAKTRVFEKWSVTQVHEATKKFTKGLRELQIQRDNKFTEIYDLKTNRKARKLIAELSDEKIVFRGKNADGEFIELEMSELVAADYYMKLQDPSLERAFDEKMLWTPEIKAAVRDAVRPETKRFADWMIEEFYPGVREIIAPYYELKFGVKMPKNPYYSPLKRFGWDDVEDTNMLVGDVFQGFPSTIPDSAKTRTGKLLPIQGTDILAVARRHELTAMQFVAFDNAVRRLRSVFGDKAVKEAVSQFYGDYTNKRMKKIVDDIARGSADTRLTIGWMDKRITSFTKASLMVNFVPFLKQLTSAPAFAADMPVKDYLVGIALFAKDPVGNTKMLLESETIYSRITRGFDRETALVLRKGRESVKTDGGKVSLRDFILNSLIMPTRGGDMIPILPGAFAKYTSVSNQLKAKGGMTETEIHEEAMREAELATLSTQQSPYIADLAAIQTAGSIVRAMAMYSTTPIQYYRNSVQAVREMRYGKISKAEGMKKVAIYWLLLPSLFQYVSNGFRWDKEEQIMAVILGPVAYYPAVGSLMMTSYDIAKGEFWKDPASSISPMFSWLDKLVGTAAGTIKMGMGDTEDWAQTLRSFGILTAQSLGLPEAGPRRMLEGAYDLYTGETRDLARLLYSSYALGDTEELGPDGESKRLLKKSKEEILTLEEKESLSKSLEELGPKVKKEKDREYQLNRDALLMSKEYIEKFKDSGLPKESIENILMKAYEAKGGLTRKDQIEYILDNL